MRTLFTLALLAMPVQVQAQYMIDTFAGSPISDGSAAKSVALFPRAVALDPSGVPYIVAFNVYRLGSDGSLTVSAGTNLNYGGDGGPANQASLWDPGNAVFDSAGNLYIADSGNGVIRKVDAATGIISTIAGTGEFGYSGDSGPAVKAKLNDPWGVAVDNAAGILYFSDTSPSVIRQVVLSTGIISTIPGVFSAVRNASPSGIGLDGRGNLYVADRGSARILKIALATNTTTTVVGSTPGFSGDGGTADKAQLSSPESVAFDGAGNMYIADNGNHRIRKVDAGTRNISTIAGDGANGGAGDGGPATGAQFGAFFSLTVDGTGNVYVADAYNSEIRMIGGDGNINSVAGGSGGDGAPAAQSQFIYPAQLSTDPDGSLYITELNRVRKVDTAGMISTIAGNGVTGFAGDNGFAVKASLGRFPNGTTLDSAGNLYIADSSNGVVRKVDRSTGVITTVAGDPQNPCKLLVLGSAATSASLCQPTGVAFDTAGNLYIADYLKNNVYVVSATDGKIGLVDGLVLINPVCVFVDQTAGDLYVCDNGHSTIVKVNLASKVVTTVAGIRNQSGFGEDGDLATKTMLDSPQAVAMDLAGNLLIADQYNNRVVAVDPKTGILSTIAGTGDYGFDGDGGPALDGLLNGPDGLAVDSAGNIYVADFFNQRVRVLRPLK